MFFFSYKISGQFFLRDIHSTCGTYCWFRLRGVHTRTADRSRHTHVCLVMYVSEPIYWMLLYKFTQKVAWNILLFFPPRSHLLTLAYVFVTVVER